MSEESLLGGNQAVEKIDGDKVRAIRESKELTQLYVATAVGVTTDTISRWENRRYPTIKRENALKLAEVLEVELAAILDADESEPEAVSPSPPAGELPPSPPAVEEPVAAGGHRSRARSVALIALVVALVVVGFFLLRWYRQSGETAVRVTAQRILPGHVAPGQAFPVQIRVRISPPGAYSMIVRETVPLSCMVLSGQPSFAAQDGTTGVVKWIGKVSGSESTFTYLAQTKPHITAGLRLEFGGAVTLKRVGASISTAVTGPDRSEVKKLHWADANGDHRIDDDEILAVYDRLVIMSHLGFGRSQSLVEDIWAGNGYRWDEAAGQPVLLQ